MSPWFMGFDNLKEEAEVEFLGIAVEVNYPCDCPKCQKGAQAISRDNNEQMHIVIAPIDKYSRLQHAFIDMSSKFKYSRRGVWEHAIAMNRIPADSKKKFQKFMMSHVILYKKTTIEEYALEYMKVPKEEIERLKKRLGINLNAQVLFPAKVIPKDAYDLYGINEEILRKRYQIFKEAWKRIKSGADENEVYEWVEEELEKIGEAGETEGAESTDEETEGEEAEGDDEDMIL